MSYPSSSAERRFGVTNRVSVWLASTAQMGEHIGYVRSTLLYGQRHVGVKVGSRDAMDMEQGVRLRREYEGTASWARLPEVGRSSLHYQ